MSSSFHFRLFKLNRNWVIGGIVHLSSRFLCCRWLFFLLAGAVGRQSALHMENSGFGTETLRRHISTFRGYWILFSIRNLYINHFRPSKIDCWFPLTYGKFLSAGRQFFFSQEKSGFCYFSREGQKIYHANISVNEQPEWFHWAHRWWSFYTYCTSHTRFRSWSFYRYRKRFGDLDQ